MFALWPGGRHFLFPFFKMPPDQTREGERARGFDWPRPPGLNTPLLSELLLSAVSAVRGGGMPNSVCGHAIYFMLLQI